eukprot:12745-Heterococcus_DN1.PRE.2
MAAARPSAALQSARCGLMHRALAAHRATCTAFSFHLVTAALQLAAAAAAVVVVVAALAHLQALCLQRSTAATAHKLADVVVLLNV